MIKNPNILLSMVNTYLRDKYNNLEDLCDSLNYDIFELKEILKTINCEYDNNLNQFVNKN